MPARASWWRGRTPSTVLWQVSVHVPRELNGRPLGVALLAPCYNRMHGFLHFAVINCLVLSCCSWNWRWNEEAREARPMSCIPKALWCAMDVSEQCGLDAWTLEKTGGACRGLYGITWAIRGTSVGNTVVIAVSMCNKASVGF